MTDPASDSAVVQCCFCGAPLPPAGARLVLLPLDDGGEQELHAHEECLRRALHPSVLLAI